jgi:hypothetical protein
MIITSNQPTKAVRSDADREKAPTAVKRVRPGNLGGARLKLQVFGDIPGFHLFWANDQDAEVEQLLSEGFEFVRPDEVSMNSWIVEDKDVAGKVSKYVGKAADGSQLRAYLLKCPDELWEERQAYGQSEASDRDQAILRGEVSRPSNAYTPAGTSIKLSHPIKS